MAVVRVINARRFAVPQPVEWTGTQILYRSLDVPLSDVTQVVNGLYTTGQSYSLRVSVFEIVSDDDDSKRKLGEVELSSVQLHHEDRLNTLRDLTMVALATNSIHGLPQTRLEVLFTLQWDNEIPALAEFPRQHRRQRRRQHHHSVTLLPPSSGRP